MEVGLGLAVGALWGYGKQFLSSKCVITTPLTNPAPEAFDIDPYLHELFIELHALSGESKEEKEAFSGAVENADRILLLEKQLRERKTYPVAGDTTRIYTCRERMALELQIVLTKCTDARKISLMKRLIMDILQRINEHYNCINALCERLCAEDLYRN